jgi:aminopeptidase-like protein
MHALAAELFPINRSITGPGFRETLDRLEAVAGPMERHRFTTGEPVFDWTIPREWEVREAWVKGPDGRVVASLEDSTLHLVGYSTPFSGRLSLDELDPHLHSLPEQPDAIPYRTSYYREDWGFCLEHRVRETLEPGEYDVLIDSELRPGHVEVGEVTVQGESEREVLLSTYCCHPSMANNELSGPVVQAHLARLLAERAARPFFTYRFVFLPETIGSIAYLARFGERLIRLLAAGYVVNCCGDPGPFTYKRSRRGDSLADRAAEHVLAHLGVPYEVIDFYPMTRSGSDERQYCSPGFDLPTGSLMRSMYGTYPEYHTSLDDLSFITPEALGQTLRAYSLIVETLEAAAQTFTVTVPYCEPQLGPRGLYPNTGGPSFAEQRLHDLLHLISLCDGTRDLLGAAEVAQRPAWELEPVARLLLEHDLLRPTAPAAEPLEKALAE